MGLPAVATGQSAAVFPMHVTGGKQAVRCFTTPPSRGATSYQALTAADLPGCMVPVEWHPEGIHVNGTWWPIVTMPWIAGQTLEQWVAGHRHEPARLETFRRAWADAIPHLHQNGIVHGDLQHGNVLVSDDGAKLWLVDYDGVVLFNPASGAQRTATPTEVGHPNYQHHQRLTTANISAYTDTFSALLIEVSIATIVADPAALTGDGNSLVFVAADLKSPDGAGRAAFERAADALSGDDLRRLLLLRSWCSRQHHQPLTYEEARTCSHLPEQATYSAPSSKPIATATNFVTPPLSYSVREPPAMNYQAQPQRAYQPAKPPQIPSRLLGGVGIALALLGALWIGLYVTQGGLSPTPSPASSQSPPPAPPTSPTEPPPPSTSTHEWANGACIRIESIEGEPLGMPVSCAEHWDVVVSRIAQTPEQCPEYYWPDESITKAYWFYGDDIPGGVACVAPNGTARAMYHAVGSCLRELPNGNLMQVPCSTSHDFTIVDTVSDANWCPDWYMEDGPSTFHCLS